jgi:anion-transporting  ArsA/GET3 family ATPase
VIDILHNARLIFVTGKGGVGKSTCAAAVARSLAEQGRRVLIAETDTYSAMSDMLGGTGAGVRPTEISENLWAVNLRSEECLVSTLTRYLPSERIVRAVTGNRVAEAFFQSAPAVNEFVLLDQILIYLEQKKPRRFDHVVVDLPASGHAVTFLSVPKTLHDMMRGIGPIAGRAAEITDRITDPDETAITAVCLPEEMPVNETLELEEQLVTELGRGLDLAMVNMIHRPPVPDDTRDLFGALRARLTGDEEPAEILAGSSADSVVRLVAGNALALDWYDRDLRHLGRLRDELDAEIVEVPMIYEIEDTALVDRVAHHLLHGPEPEADSLAS